MLKLCFLYFAVIEADSSDKYNYQKRSRLDKLGEINPCNLTILLSVTVHVTEELVPIS